MLLLGGFAIAAALSKHFIAKQLAVAILSRVGRKPQHVILANMLVATFASMWISNVAAPVLCFSLVQPILRTLPTSHPFCKSLVMGIALASNLGGMTSPISSPQNIFAIERMSMGGMPPSWLQWFAVALPVAVLGNLVCWALILMAYRPGETIKEVRGGAAVWPMHWVVVGGCGVTTHLSPALPDMSEPGCVHSLMLAARHSPLLSVCPGRACCVVLAPCVCVLPACRCVR